MEGYNWTDAKTPEGRERLKELLDSGHLIPCNYESKNRQAYWLAFFRDGKYWLSECEATNRFDEAFCTNLSFIDPRPRVLPLNLEWHDTEMGEESMAVHGDWSFYAWVDGTWEIRYDSEAIAGGECEDKTMYDSKKAVHEWRVDHLKSMLK